MKKGNEFSSLLNMIKEATNKSESKGIAIDKVDNKIIYGEMEAGNIINPIELEILDKNNICQELYDSLTSEFGEQLRPANSHSYDGYKYFMFLGKNVIIFFPQNYEYQNWIYNQIQKDKENRNAEKNKIK